MGNIWRPTDKNLHIDRNLKKRKPCKAHLEKLVHVRSKDHGNARTPERTLRQADNCIFRDEEIVCLVKSLEFLVMLHFSHAVPLSELTDQELKQKHCCAVSKIGLFALPRKNA